MSTIPVHLAIEDQLSEAVLRRLLDVAGRGYSVGTVYGRTGFGYLRNTIHGWNAAARGIPFIVLTDLDTHACPMALIRNWLPHRQSPNLLLRVAVREVEAWLLADAASLATYLAVPLRRIPADPEQLSDPKAVLVEIAAASGSRTIRQRIVPKRGSTAKQGPDYNACLVEFVREVWDVAAAVQSSPSLARTVARLARFTPTWPPST